MRTRQRTWTVLRAVVTAASLLLALGCITMWVITENSLYLKGWEGSSPNIFWVFSSGLGRLQLVYENGAAGGVIPLSHVDLAGFEYGTYNCGWNLYVPWWFPAALLLILPTLWVLQIFRRKRQREQNLCKVCGYDLRATPARCPECGTMRNNQAMAIQPTGTSGPSGHENATEPKTTSKGTHL
jgi:hypothetical protein